MTEVASWAAAGLRARTARNCLPRSVCRPETGADGKRASTTGLMVLAVPMTFHLHFDLEASRLLEHQRKVEVIALKEAFLKPDQDDLHAAGLERKALAGRNLDRGERRRPERPVFPNNRRL